MTHAARRTTTALLAAIAATGCTATGSLEETAPVEVALGEHREARIRVTSRASEDDEILHLVEGKLAARLVRAGVFERVHASTVALGDPTIELRVRIVDLDRVSTTERAWLGAFAGRGRVRLEIDLVDLATGRVVGSVAAEGKSSAGTAFAGTTSQAVDQAVDRVASHLAERR